MADIVLKDRTGDAQTFSDATALGVDTPDGGIAVFVSKDLIPEGYTHPDTHPASMITGLADVATGGSYNDLKDTPVGDYDSLAESTIEFSKLGELSCYLHELTKTLELIEGETYTVVWDGISYACVCKDMHDLVEAVESGTGYGLGNAAQWLGVGAGEDTGEPFIVVSQKETGGCMINTTDSSPTHTVSIVPVNAYRKLDAKYLPDGVATEAYVRQEIAKSGSVVSGEGITAADVTAMLASAGVIVPVAVEDNLLLSDSEGDIYIL